MMISFSVSVSSRSKIFTFWGFPVWHPISRTMAQRMDNVGFIGVYQLIVLRVVFALGNYEKKKGIGYERAIIFVGIGFW